MRRKPDEDFFTLVYEVVRLIPYGRVTSYGAIAKALGAAGSARVVGYALAQTYRLESDPGFPAHRVLNRNGALSGWRRVSWISALILLGPLVAPPYWWLHSASRTTREA